MDSLSGCSSAVVTERLSTVTWGTRQPSIRASAIQSVGVGGQTNTQLQGLYTIRKELQTIEARECPYRDLKGEVLLGEGETFTVNRCDLEGRVVAVKHLKLGSWATNATKFASRLTAVLMELRIMCYSPLRDHPNILSLLGYGWRHEHQAILPYVVVDYSSHGTFRDFLKADGALDVPLKKRLIQDVGYGIDALHSCGIVHGDLKLDNVLIFDRSVGPKAEKVAKICDFGHSLLLSDNDDHLIYRGTTIYNAPEVYKQTFKAIEKSMLPRCDIWAFGLLALEVVMDGDAYIDHLEAGIYFTETLVHDNPQFFCGAVLNTAMEASNGISGWKNFFKGLFRRTLLLEPQARTAYLSATLPQPQPHLQVPKKWDWSFDMFHPEQTKGYSWEQQKQIFNDFALSYARDRQNSPAAFQLGICYLIGFGVPIDNTLAQEYLSKAERSKHFVSMLINPLLQDSTGRDHHHKLYTAAVVRGLAPKGTKSINMPIYLSLGDSSFTILTWSRLREQIERLEQRAWVGTISSTLGENNVDNRFSSIRVTRREIADFELVPHNWTKAPLNLLECAIMFRDVEMIERLGRWRQRLMGGTGVLDDTTLDYDEWATIRSETLLTQGLRTGDIQVVKALLLFGARFTDTTADGCTMLHWLFMLGSNVVPFSKKHLKKLVFRELIDLPCTRARELHKQWPFQLVGTPLAFSIWAGSVDAVTVLLRLGADPAAPAFGEFESLIDGVLWTHLHLAAMLHHAEILVLLIAALDPQKKLHLSTSSIAQVLCYSSKIERIAIHGQFTDIALQRTVAALEVLDQNSLWRDDSIAECRRYSPLAAAIEFNDNDVAKALLAKYPHLATTPVYDPEDRSYYTYPAHIAVRFGSRHDVNDSVSMLELLFYHNQSSFHTLDSSGNSPLHVAVTEYPITIPRWLLDCHVDSPLLNVVDRDGRTALHYCASADTAELLLQRGISVNHADSFGMTSLHCAALIGASEVMKVLIRWDADVDAVDVTASSALHYSVASGSSEAVQMLLVRGTYIHMQNVHGESALHIAARRQREDLVRELLQSGASTALQNNQRLTPLHNAVYMETSDPRKLVLLCSREVVSLVDQTGNNIIHACALLGRLDWLENLKCFYSIRDLNARNENGEAPIHIATKKLDARVALHLLDNGADVNLLDDAGNTSFHLALLVQGRSEAEREYFCRLLISHRATVGGANHSGQTPWSITAQSLRSSVLMSMIFNSGGEQVCHGIIFHDVMLQAAFGEKEVANAIAYYDEAGMHRITRISRFQLAEISTKYTDSTSLLLPLGFQDYEKEVYVPEDLEDLEDPENSDTPVQTLTEASTSYSNLPEATVSQNTHGVSFQIDRDNFPEVVRRQFFSEVTTDAEDKVSKTYDALIRGLKVAGMVTGGTVLAAALLPTTPVLLPLWFWRRQRVMQKMQTDPLEAEELDDNEIPIAELDASNNVHWLSHFALEKTSMGVDAGETLPEYVEDSNGPYELPCNPAATVKAAAMVQVGVDSDLAMFLIKERITRVLDFAEQAQKQEHHKTAIIEELDENDDVRTDESNSVHSVIATSGSDMDSSALTSYLSGNSGSCGSSSRCDTATSDTRSLISIGGFSFEYGQDEISVAKEGAVHSVEISPECSCAECVRSKFLREQPQSTLLTWLFLQCGNL